jgi:hypothetical protein
MRTADLVREYCTLTRHPEADAAHRADRLRKANLIPTGGRGPNAARIGAKHASRFLISILSNEYAIKASQIIESYGGLIACNEALIIDETGQSGGGPIPVFLAGKTFEQALSYLIQVSPQWKMEGRLGVGSISITRAGPVIRATIYLTERTEKGDQEHISSFESNTAPELPLGDDGQEIFYQEQTFMLRGQVIEALAMKLQAEVPLLHSEHSGAEATTPAGSARTRPANVTTNQCQGAIPGLSTQSSNRELTPTHILLGPLRCWYATWIFRE